MHEQNLEDNNSAILSASAVIFQLLLERIEKTDLLVYPPNKF